MAGWSSCQGKNKDAFQNKKTPSPIQIEPKTAYFVWSGFDFHSVPEGDPDVVLAVDRDEIDKALELRRVEFRHQVSLLPQGVKELPDG
jgi:hypothetical protein